MPELERDIIRKIKKFLSTFDNVWYFKTHGSFMQTAGIPDLIMSVFGKFVAFEIKTKTGKLSKLQEITCQNIKEKGGWCIITYGYKDFVKEFTDIYQILWRREKEKTAEKI